MSATGKRSDDELMLALGQGDGASLGVLVARHQGPLVGYLTTIVHDAERARDLAQETFLKVFRYASSYRTHSRFTTWLYHIARNVARDELRARKRRPHHYAASDAGLEQAAAETPAIEEAIARRDAVLTALGCLGARDRQLIVLRDLEGLSYEEISDRTGIRLGTVKSGLSRARTRFAQEFARLG